MSENESDFVSSDSENDDICESDDQSSESELSEDQEDTILQAKNYICQFKNEKETKTVSKRKDLQLCYICPKKLVEKQIIYVKTKNYICINEHSVLYCVNCKNTE